MNLKGMDIMYQQAQQHKYTQTAIQTASPAQLLIMLHDGAIRFGRIAIEGIRQRKYDIANENLCKVQDIVHELAVTLDKESPIAEHLLQLYDYFLYRLIEANREKAIEPIEEIIGHLTELKQTWIEAVHSDQRAGVVLHG